MRFLKKYWIIITVLLLLSASFFVANKILAQFASFEVYYNCGSVGCVCPAGENCTSYPTVTNVNVPGAPVNGFETITADAADISGILNNTITAVIKNSSGTEIDREPMPNVTGNSFGASIDVSEYPADNDYFVNIIAVDNLLNNSWNEDGKYEDPAWFFHVGTPEDQQPPTGWDYRAKITVNTSEVPLAQSNFPVYVNLADMPAEFFNYVKSDGGDIRVTNSSGTGLLAMEVVAIDKPAHTGELWFKADSISDGSDYYIYCGNSSAVEPAPSSTYGSQHVWDDGGSNYFKGVWHLASGTSAIDSTLNGNNSIDFYTPPTATPGQIDGASNFYGGGLTFSGPASADKQTISFWMRGTNVSDGWQATAIADSSVGLFVTGSKLSYYFGGDHYNNTPLLNNTWYYVTITNDSGDLRFYLNGSPDGEVSYATRGGIGYFGTDELGENFAGKLDEVRFSSSVRSADWIKTEYNNQVSSSAFYTVAGEEVASGANASGFGVANLGVANIGVAGLSAVAQTVSFNVIMLASLILLIFIYFLFHGQTKSSTTNK